MFFSVLGIDDLLHRDLSYQKAGAANAFIKISQLCDLCLVVMAPAL
jgi:hypothetical protein